MNEHGSGMIQSGKWVNTQTGEEVFVRDSLIDGDKMVVITNKGQLSMEEFSKYIQCEEGEVIPTLADLYGKNDPSLMARINQGISLEDRIKISNSNEQPNINSSVIKKVEEKPNYDLIKKVFDKYPIERTIDFEIVEEEWPFKEFSMLVNILDVPIKDICSYVIDNFFDKEHLVESLSEYFEKHISEC